MQVQEVGGGSYDQEVFPPRLILSITRIVALLILPSGYLLRMECDFFFFLRFKLKSFSKFRKYLCKLTPEKWIPGHWGSVRAICRGKSPDPSEGVHLTDVHLASTKTGK